MVDASVLFAAHSGSHHLACNAGAFAVPLAVLDAIVEGQLQASSAAPPTFAVLPLVWLGCCRLGLLNPPYLGFGFLGYLAPAGQRTRVSAMVRHTLLLLNPPYRGLEENK